MEYEHQKTDGLRKRKRDRILADTSLCSVSAQRLYVDPSSKEPGPATESKSLEARLTTTDDSQTAYGLTNFQPSAVRNGSSTKVKPVARVEGHLPHGPSEILRSTRPLTAASRSKLRKLTASRVGPNQPTDKSNLEAHAHKHCLTVLRRERQYCKVPSIQRLQSLRQTVRTSPCC